MKDKRILTDSQFTLEMEGICNHHFVDDKDLSQDNDIESVKNKIRRREKLQEDINGRTLLHHAATNGDSKTLAILITDLKKINNQSEVNRIDKDGNTPLHYSFKKDCIEILLKNRARIMQNKEGQAPIHCAAIKNSPESIEYYISYYIRMNIASRLCVQDKKGCTFFHYALKNSMNINYIKHIYNKGVKFFENNELIADKDGRSLLAYSAMSGNHSNFISFFLFLITIPEFRAKYEINRVDGNGAKILHYAAQSDNENLLKFIIEQGISRGEAVHLDNKYSVIVDNNGWNLFHYAVKSNTSNCLKFLFKQLKEEKQVNLNKEIDGQDKFGNTALHYTAQYGHNKCMELLIENRADIYIKNNDGINSLHFAAYYGNESCIKLLISHSKNEERYINSKTSDNKTPFLCALEGGHKSCAIFLYNQGTNITHYCSDGRTALHYAAMGNNTACIDYVIHKLFPLNRNCVNAQDNYGKIPIHFTKNEECFYLLIKHGSNIVQEGKLICDYSGQTILHSAAETGNTSFLKLILTIKDIDINYEINQKDNHRRLPIHCAIQKKNLENIELLLKTHGEFYENEANSYDRCSIYKLLLYNHDDQILHAKDQNGKTPYDYALEDHCSLKPSTLKLFLNFLQKMKDSKSRVLNRIESELIKRSTAIITLSTLAFALFSIRSYTDLSKSHALNVFETVVRNIVAGLVVAVFFCPTKQQRKLQQTIKECSEKIGEIHSKIEESERISREEKLHYIEDLQQSVQDVTEIVSEIATRNMSNYQDDYNKINEDNLPSEKVMSLIMRMFLPSHQQNWKILKNTDSQAKKNWMNLTIKVLEREHSEKTIGREL